MTGSEDKRKAIQRIVQKLSGDYEPQKVILFGSHAQGDPEPDSDIDLSKLPKVLWTFPDSARPGGLRAGLGT